IHQGSQRRDKQFVVADCAALAPSILESELFGHVRGAFTGATTNKAGLFQIAHEGTLFLDEVANISPDIQGKLLRVLESNEYKPVGSGMMKKTDVRLIAATNRDLSEMILEGDFREDLFYRLNVFPIQIPPLRERDDDIEYLARHFLKHFASKGNKPVPEFTDKAIEALKRHAWPGNVRELKNVVERIIIMTDGAVIEDTGLVRKALPESDAGPHEIPKTAEALKKAKNLARKHAVQDLECAFILEALKKSKGNVSRAAKQTGMQRTYFQALMKRHGIHAEDHRLRDET
ncbi:MAG: sigma-54 interaction domain-containing protein, partial [Planctomycetota bacterium]